MVASRSLAFVEALGNIIEAVNDKIVNELRAQYDEFIIVSNYFSSFLFLIYFAFSNDTLCFLQTFFAGFEQH